MRLEDAIRFFRSIWSVLIECRRHIYRVYLPFCTTKSAVYITRNSNASRAILEAAGVPVPRDEAFGNMNSKPVRDIAPTSATTHPFCISPTNLEQLTTQLPYNHFSCANWGICVPRDDSSVGVRGSNQVLEEMYNDSRIFEDDPGFSTSFTEEYWNITFSRSRDGRFVASSEENFQYIFLSDIKGNFS